MARTTLSMKVLEREKRARDILDGLFNVSDPLSQQLILQAITELDGIRRLCFTAGEKGAVQVLGDDPAFVQERARDDARIKSMREARKSLSAARKAVQR